MHAMLNLLFGEFFTSRKGKVLSFDHLLVFHAVVISHCRTIGHSLRYTL